VDPPTNLFPLGRERNLILVPGPAIVRHFNLKTPKFENEKLALLALLEEIENFALENTDHDVESIARPIAPELHLGMRSGSGLLDKLQLLLGVGTQKPHGPSAVVAVMELFLLQNDRRQPPAQPLSIVPKYPLL